MLRLFLSLYLAVALAFVAFFFGIQFIAERVVNRSLTRSLEPMVAGPHYLLEQELLAHPVADWPAQIERLQSHFGYPINLVDRDAAELEPDEAQRLRAGRPLIKNLDEAEVWYLPLSHDDLLLQVWVEQPERDHAERSTSGFFHLLFKTLQSHPELEWPQAIAELQGHFSSPLRLIALDDLDLPPEDLQRLQRGQILGYDVDNHKQRYFKRIDTSSQVLMVGPILEPWLLRVIPYVAIGILAAIMACAVLLWLRPVWRDMTALDRSTTAFGSGDLHTRVQVSRRSPLRQLAGTFNDMAARIQRLIDAQNELVDAVSHELRTPIARMRFGIDMLATADNTTDRQRYMTSMETDIDELDTLVNELLTYARLDRAEPVWQWQRVELGTWLTSIVNTLQPEAHTISLECQVAPEVALQEAELEPNLMPRAIGNLIRNALCYADHNVRVSLTAATPEIILYVDDDGPGIPPAHRQTIFEPFRRLDTSRNRESGGHGLGLAIVQRIAASHQGEVYIEDSPLGGARFCLRWPRLQSLQGQTVDAS